MQHEASGEWLRVDGLGADLQVAAHQLLTSPAQAAPPLQEATLLPEEEQQGLATSLDNWRGAVQSAVAAAALQLRVAEQQAVAAVGRCAAQLDDLITHSQTPRMQGVEAVVDSNTPWKGRRCPEAPTNKPAAGRWRTARPTRMRC